MALGLSEVTVTPSQVLQPRNSNFICNARTLPARIRHWVAKVLVSGKRTPSPITTQLGRRGRCKYCSGSPFPPLLQESIPVPAVPAAVAAVFMWRCRQYGTPPPKVHQ
ncbi:MAG: hypothetical protein R3E39_25955 [Anaerolineae bacterium]